MTGKLGTRILELLRYGLAPRAPAELAANFTVLSESARATLVHALVEHYFSRKIWGEAEMTASAWLQTSAGRDDQRQHVDERLTTFRHRVIPWLAAAKPLRGARILEIGCGTGASTVALAEQGAQVVAVDLDEASVAAARVRCDLHAVKAEFVLGNAIEILPALTSRHFDFIIFFACLEHMTHDERMQSMRLSWQHLDAGDLWCLVETPNRLWYHDEHTAQLDFYHWLPDELAFEYSRFSPRSPFNQAYRNPSADALLDFQCHGRGLSYHEFDLSMVNARELDVVSSTTLYWRSRPHLFGLRKLNHLRQFRYRYENTLARLGPELHRGLIQPYLDLIIRKH